MRVRNIFSDIPEQIPKEVFEDIVHTQNCRVQRIVSKGQFTPPGEWYDQDGSEWVILLKGSAALLFEGDERLIELKPGDYLNIPARARHRVESTDENEETIWLVVHYD